MFCQICSRLPHWAPQTATFYTFHRFYQTHYQVLNLPNNCTSQEIRSAFIKLSKQYHPDVNKSKESHVRFQKINEAYAVLGKPFTRREYDLGLSGPDPSYNTTNTATSSPKKPHVHIYRDPYKDPVFWANRNKDHDQYYKDNPYYGIRGIPKLPNYMIMMACIVFGIVSFGIQFILVSKSATFKRDELTRRSLLIEKSLNEIRLAAENNGNESQIEALKRKLLKYDEDADK